MTRQIKVHMTANDILRAALFSATVLTIVPPCPAAEPEPVIPVAAQPLAANVTRLVEALDFLGASLPPDKREKKSVDSAIATQLAIPQTYGLAPSAGLSPLR